MKKPKNVENSPTALFWFGALHNWVAQLSQPSVNTTKTKQKETVILNNATTEFQHLREFIIFVSWIFKIFFDRIKWWNITVIWPKLERNRCKIGDFFILLQFIIELQTPQHNLSNWKKNFSCPNFPMWTCHRATKWHQECKRHTEGLQETQECIKARAF